MSHQGTTLAHLVAVCPYCSSIGVIPICDPWLPLSVCLQLHCQRWKKKKKDVWSNDKTAPQSTHHVLVYNYHNYLSFLKTASFARIQSETCSMPCSIFRKWLTYSGKQPQRNYVMRFGVKLCLIQSRSCWFCTLNDRVWSKHFYGV